MRQQILGLAMLVCAVAFCAAPAFAAYPPLQEPRDPQPVGELVFADDFNAPSPVWVGATVTRGVKYSTMFVKAGAQGLLVAQDVLTPDRFVVESTFEIATARTAGVMVNYAGPSDYLQIIGETGDANGDGGGLTFFGLSGNIPTAVRKFDVPIMTGHRYRLRVEADPPRYALFLDDLFIGVAESEPLAGRGVGLVVSHGAAVFANFAAWAMPAAGAVAPALPDPDLTYGYLGAFRYVYRTELEGHYINDHSFVFKDGVWHLFHIKGNLWEPMYSEISFGHAVSPDLTNWTAEPDVLTHDVHHYFESSLIFAPNVIEKDGVYYMFYAGVGRTSAGWGEWMCLATSTDLYNWDKYPGNPIFTPNPAWADYLDPQTPVSCRDPHLTQLADGRYAMYYTAMTSERRPAVAVALSDDLLHWTDHGPVLTRPVGVGDGVGVPVGEMESSTMREIGGRYYLFYTQNYTTNYVISDNPLNFFGRPIFALGPQHASEIFEANGVWWATHPSFDPYDAIYRYTDRTRGLYLSRISFAHVKPVTVVPWPGPDVAPVTPDDNDSRPHQGPGAADDDDDDSGPKPVWSRTRTVGCGW